MYLVMMYRWGDRENHSYPKGVYEDLEIAYSIGNYEKGYRGGKYDPFIFEGEINCQNWRLLSDEELKERINK